MKVVEAKVVILGSQGVGKTSMILRYIDKVFNEQISPTIGASFFTCNVHIRDARVKLQIWDTAGQERFKSMAPMYYRNAQAAILVFDITQYYTFTSVKHWVKELNFNVDEAMVLILVGNKTDLSTERKVSQEEALSYAETIGGHYFECSAWQDEGVEDIIVNLSKQLIRQSDNSNAPSVNVYNITGSVGSLSRKDFQCTETVSSSSSSRLRSNHIVLENNSSSEVPKKKSCC